MGVCTLYPIRPYSVLSLVFKYKKDNKLPKLSNRVFLTLDKKKTPSLTVGLAQVQYMVRLTLFSGSKYFNFLRSRIFIGTVFIYKAI